MSAETLTLDNKLDLILAKLDHMEQRLNHLESLTELPGVTATLANTVDEYAQSLESQGISVSDTVEQLKTLLPHLLNPELLHNLGILCESLPQLTALLPQISEASGVMAMAANSLDEISRGLQEQGMDLNESFVLGKELLLQLVHPDTLRIFQHLTQETDELHAMVQVIKETSGTIAAVSNMMDDTSQKLIADGVDLAQSAHTLKEIAFKALEPEVLELINGFLEETEQLKIALNFTKEASGLVATLGDTVDGLYPKVQHQLYRHEALINQFKHTLKDESTSHTLADLGQAFVASRKAHQPASMFSLLKAAKSPEFQQLIGFVISFSKHFGQTLKHKTL